MEVQVRSLARCKRLKDPVLAAAVAQIQCLAQEPLLYGTGAAILKKKKGRT